VWGPEGDSGGLYNSLLYVLKSYEILVYLKCLHVYLHVGHTAQVCLLLKHRANQHLQDATGLEPLTIAVEEANADIVTL
jgi:hypothetical protein